MLMLRYGNLFKVLNGNPVAWEVVPPFNLLVLGRE